MSDFAAEVRRRAAETDDLARVGEDAARAREALREDGKRRDYVAIEADVDRVFGEAALAAVGTLRHTKSQEKTNQVTHRLEWLGAGGHRLLKLTIDQADGWLTGEWSGQQQGGPASSSFRPIATVGDRMWAQDLVFTLLDAARWKDHLPT